MYSPINVLFNSNTLKKYNKCLLLTRFCYNNNMAQIEKLKINPWRIILIFIFSFLVLEAIFYFSLQNFAQNGFFPFSNSFYFYTPFLVVISILFCVLSITQTYYEIDKEKISHHKMGKVYEYKFKDIMFVDEEWSKKHKMLMFYLNDGKARYLAFDKEGKIFLAVINKAKLMSWEEYKIHCPNAKI